jgi:hypothetical protein
MTSIHPDILSLDPIPMPKPVLKAPEGETLDLEEVTRLAGMKYVVSNPGGFSIRLVPGNRDLIERRPGFRVYAIGRDGIPEDPRAGSREILRRLAYAFHDWAAREIVARYHRDLKRDARP